MTNIITADDDLNLARAMEANLAAFWMGYGQAPTGDAYTDSHIARFSSIMPHPLFNAAFSKYFATQEAAQRDAAVQDTTAYFRTRQRSAMWWVGPTAQSPALTETLIRSGWQHIGNAPGMLLDLHTFDARLASLDGLAVERVESLDSLYQWVSVLAPANDIAPVMLDTLYKLEATRGIETDVYVRYLARFNGQAVAAAAVYYHAGVAGIFAVATDAKARGRGFGGAITAASLVDAKRRGYRFSVLQASELGYPVYKRLGFQHRWLVNLFALR